MTKKYTQLISILLVSLLLCGCQRTPKKGSVTSKNDGVFQERINLTTPANSGKQDIAPINLEYLEKFTSSDGTVNFEIDIDGQITPNVFQVVEVEPHRLTEDDIRRVATVLLGDANFYERRSSSNPQYSKAQYQQMINRLSVYANHDTLAELMGTGGAYTYLEYVQFFIEFWTEKYESAPEDDPRVPCNWTLKKERHYNDSDIEIGNRSIDEDCDVLYASTEKDGIEYFFSVRTRDGGGYKINKLNLSLTEGIGLSPVDMAIYRSMLCRTGKPTAEQVSNIETKVEDMLVKMDLGEWKIAETKTEIEQIDDIAEYTIHVSAVPVLNGVPSLYGQSSGNMQDAYNATYLMTRADFVFSANGDIIYFNMDSPLNVISTRNENVTTLPVTELYEKCKQQLTLSDAGAYGLGVVDRQSIEKATEEKILCKVKLSEVEYSLGRVQVPNCDDRYYYIPVMAFKGFVYYVGEKTGTIHYSNSTGQPNEWIPPLICINAVDGSIISQ